MTTFSTNKCDVCSDTGRVYCYKCRKIFCKNCEDRHDSSEWFTDHEKVELGEDEPDVFACAEHQNEKLEFYCNGCERALCCLCLIQNHHDHETCRLHRKIQDLSERLTRSEHDLLQKVESLVGMKSTLEDWKDRNVNSRRYLIKQVSERKEELMRLLDAEEQRLVTQINDIFEEKQASLDHELSRIEKRKKAMQRFRVKILSLNRPLSLIRELKSDTSETECSLSTANGCACGPLNVDEWKPAFVKHATEIHLGEIIESSGRSSDSGIIRYSREFLLILKDCKQAKIKPPSLPKLEDIIVEYTPHDSRVEQQLRRGAKGSYLSESEVKDFVVHFTVILEKGKRTIALYGNKF